MNTKNSDRQFEHSLSSLVANAASRTKFLHEKSIKEKKIPSMHMGRMNVLSILEEQSQTQADLCKKLGIKPPSMMEMLGKLERDDIVTREPHPEDGRKYNWKLTAQGKRSFAKAKKMTLSLSNEMDAFLKKKSIKKQQIEDAKKVLSALVEFSETKL